MAAKPRASQSEISDPLVQALLISRISEMGLQGLTRKE